MLPAEIIDRVHFAPPQCYYSGREAEEEYSPFDERDHVSVRMSLVSLLPPHKWALITGVLAQAQDTQGRACSRVQPPG